MKETAYTVKRWQRRHKKITKKRCKKTVVSHTRKRRRSLFAFTVTRKGIFKSSIWPLFTRLGFNNLIIKEIKCNKEDIEIGQQLVIQRNENN